MASSNPNETAAATRAESPTRSPRSASISLQAAATLNAGLQHQPSRTSSSSSLRNRQSPHTGRRRSTVLMNLQLNDPSIPAPGEMVSESQISHRTSSPVPISGSPLLMAGDPHHHRTPSLGELHQELEAEQEAQVNRLLQMIRQQQLQLQQLQATQGHGQPAPSAEEYSAISERSITQPASQTDSAPQSAFPLPPASGTFARSPIMPHPRSSFDMARSDLQRRSRTPSRGASPRLRSTSISGEPGDPLVLGGRDESAFYQAETQMLIRENQMLRHRIRDLEKQLTDIPTNANATASHEPASHSHLMQTTSASTEGDNSARVTPSAVEASSSGTVEAAKDA